MTNSLISTIKEQEELLEELGAIYTFPPHVTWADGHTAPLGKEGDTVYAGRYDAHTIKGIFRNSIISILEELCEEMEKSKKKFAILELRDAGYNQALDEQISNLKEVIRQLRENT